MYEGDTDGYGDELSETVTVETWHNPFLLMITFTMPDDLGDIGSWDGLLGKRVMPLAEAVGVVLGWRGG